MERFLSYLYNKRICNFYFLVFMIILNFLALSQKVYAFNILSIMVMPFWWIILSVDMDADAKDENP